MTDAALGLLKFACTSVVASLLSDPQFLVSVDGVAAIGSINVNDKTSTPLVTRRIRTRNFETRPDRDIEESVIDSLPG